MLNRRKRIRELEEENIAFSDRIGMMEDKLENSNLEYKILMKKYDDKSDAYDNLTYKYEDLLEENKRLNLLANSKEVEKEKRISKDIKGKRTWLNGWHGEGEVE